MTDTVRGRRGGAAKGPGAGSGGALPPDLASTWAARGVDASTLAPDADGTIRYTPAATRTRPLSPQDLQRLTGPASQAEPVELGPVLGEGSMGIVRLGRQPALRRQVAVKQVHPRAAGTQAATALVREAWVAAGLEHPNIVPIHTLHHRDDGPLLVMKRIEGTAWSEVLKDPAAAGFSTSDPLGFHLDVLTRVCHAVHFAHTRRVVHLDLKPDNVMLGSFGEVYVLDWGLAATYGDPANAPAEAEGDVRTQHVRDIHQVCGTPAYMAPEQAVGEGEHFGPTTDVYLLGAILHHIVTGHPPHRGESVFATVLHAYESAPAEYGPDVSPELARILHRAMAREPADRFASAEELRLALEAYLHHRSSEALMVEALARLDHVRTWLAEGAALPSGVLQPADEASVQRAVSECRFGFQQALRIWPDNVTARDGLQELLTLVIRRAAHRGDWAQAVAALEELPQPDPELSQMVEALRERFRQDRAAARELRALRRDLDIDVAWRARFRLALAIGPFWLLWNVVSGFLYRSERVDFDYGVLFVSVALSLAVFLVGRSTMARPLLTTRVNRQGMWLLGAGMFSAGVLWAMCAALGVPLLTAVGLTIAIQIFFLIGLAAVVDTRTAWAVPAALPFTVILAYFPSYSFEVNGVIGLIGAWSLAWVWRRPTTQPAQDGQDAEPTAGRHETTAPAPPAPGGSSQ